MIHLLVVFQFIFLYIPILFIGMTIYGTEIKSLSGYSYLASIGLISLLLFFLKTGNYPRLFIKLHRPIAIIGGVSALVLYRGLHFNFWDEHSLNQALLILCIGLASSLSSINAAILLKAIKPSTRTFINSFGLLAIMWLMAIYYPMIAFLFIALLLLIWPIFTGSTTSTYKYQPAKFSRYFIFLIFMDLPLVAWDYQVDTQWAVYFSIIMLATGFGFLLRFNDKLRTLFYTLFVINFLYCAIQADYVLNPAHSFITAFVFGIYLSHQHLSDRSNFILFPALAAPAFVGFILSIVFYSNLSLSIWRIIFILPLILFFIKNLYKPQVKQ